MALRWYIFFVNLGSLGLYLLAFDQLAEFGFVYGVAGLHLLTNLALWLYFLYTKGPREYMLGFRYSAILGFACVVGPWLLVIVAVLVAYLVDAF